MLGVRSKKPMNCKILKLFPEGVATCVICEKRAINFSPTELLLQDLPLPLVTSFTLTIFAFQKKVLSKEGLALGGSAFLIFTVVSCLGVSNRSLIPNGGTNFLNSWVPFFHEQCNILRTWFQFRQRSLFLVLAQD